MGHRFGQRLRELRESRDLLQREMEKDLNLRAGTASQYERGLREPGFDMLLAFAEYFDVSADYLLGRPGALPESPALRDARGRLAMLMHRRRPQGVPALLLLARQAAPEVFSPAQIARRLGLKEEELQAPARLTPEGLHLVMEYLGVPPGSGQPGGIGRTGGSHHRAASQTAELTGSQQLVFPLP